MTTRVLLLLALIVEVVGLVTSLLLLVDARRDLTAVVSRGIHNGRRIVARTSLRTELLRLLSLVALTFTTASAIASLWDRSFPVTLPLLAARAALLVTAGLILAQSLSVYSMRRRLFDAHRADRPPAVDPITDPPDDLEEATDDAV